MPKLVRIQAHPLTLLVDKTASSRLSFGFTERTGGVSSAPYASLNLGWAVGDDRACVIENRARVLEVFGAADLYARLIVPTMAHKTRSVVINSSDPKALADARASAQTEADILVCTAEDVPVLLCFADCVPIILISDKGFALVHSGWRGSLAGIAGKAVRELCACTSLGPQDITAYIGPHIGPDDYEVSEDLAKRFSERWGIQALRLPSEASAPSATIAEPAAPAITTDFADTATTMRISPKLDLGYVVEASLAESGIQPQQIAHWKESTASTLERFFSHRQATKHPPYTTGRHGAFAMLCSTDRLRTRA